jgi:glyoxylase-like metal-dependent hydrolase (beta-lactamase superfamily II)
MTIKTLMMTLGIADTNCYVVGDEVSKEAVIIDAPADAPRILASIEKEGWTVREILLTHAHFDHVLAVSDLKAATGATVRLHRDDLSLLRELPLWMKQITGETVPTPPDPDVFVDEGDVITVGEMRFDVLFTPGHAPGHVAYVLHSERVVFSGDCLFLGSIGRTDLPGGDHAMLMNSIMKKLMPLPEDYTVACGHGQTTTLMRERMSNPYIFDWANLPDSEY